MRRKNAANLVENAVKWESSLNGWLNILLSIVSIGLAAYFGFLAQHAEYIPIYLFSSLAILFCFLIFQITQVVILERKNHELTETQIELSSLRSSIVGAGARYPALIGAVAQFQASILGPLSAVLRREEITPHQRERLTDDCNAALKALLARVADSTRTLVAAQHADVPDAVWAKIRLLDTREKATSYETVARSDNNRKRVNSDAKDHMKIENHYIYSQLKNHAYPDRIFSGSNHTVNALIGDQRSQYIKPEYNHGKDTQIICVPIFGPSVALGKDAILEEFSYVTYSSKERLIGFINVYSDNLIFDKHKDGDILIMSALCVFSSISLIACIKEKLR